jgi:hypothetical protein
MAKQMPYDDQFGNHYDTSYWRLVQTNIGWADRAIVAIFYGYKDAASRAANRQAIGSKTYAASGDEFDQFLTQYTAANPKPDIRNMAYIVATQTRDVVVDPNDLSKNVSFFAEAQDLL